MTYQGMQNYSSSDWCNFNFNGDRYYDGYVMDQVSVRVIHSNLKVWNVPYPPYHNMPIVMGRVIGRWAEPWFTHPPKTITIGVEEWQPPISDCCSEVSSNSSGSSTGVGFLEPWKLIEPEETSISGRPLDSFEIYLRHVDRFQKVVEGSAKNTRDNRNREATEAMGSHCFCSDLSIMHRSEWQTAETSSAGSSRIF